MLYVALKSADIEIPFRITHELTTNSALGL